MLLLIGALGQQQPTSYRLQRASNCRVRQPNTSISGERKGIVLYVEYDTPCVEAELRMKGKIAALWRQYLQKCIFNSVTCPCIKERLLLLNAHSSVTVTLKSCQQTSQIVSASISTRATAQQSVACFYCKYMERSGDTW